MILGVIIMKKILVISLIVTILITGVVSGMVYAGGTHQPLVGNKLIGTGYLGLGPDGTRNMVTNFRITNPDCKKDIYIDSIAVLSPGPRGANEIYHGPLYLPDISNPNNPRLDSHTLWPHRILGLSLSVLMWTNETGNSQPMDPANWLTAEEALLLPLSSYTVEIKWHAQDNDPSVCQLIGWQYGVTSEYRGPKDRGIMATSESPMINLTQY
jgi:hypothetical protein